VDAGLPAVVSFCCRADGRLLSGERLEDAVAACGEAALALAVNCVAVEDLTAPLEALRASARGDVGFYANLGRLDAEGAWRPEDALTPERYARLVETWYQRGFQWVGGCCGSRPEHIRALTHPRGRGSPV
jgi:S-methylmethionine-dependent homocysteine/selenocysteine methylase